MGEVETTDLSSRKDTQWGNSVGGLVGWPSVWAGSLAGKAHQGCVQVGGILVPVGRWEALADQKGNSLTLPGHGRAKQNYHHQDCFNPSFLIGQGTITSPTPVLSPRRNLNFICLGQESVPRVPASCVHLAAWVICLTPRSDPVIAWIWPLEASHRRISNPLERHPSPSHLAPASLVVCSSPNTSNMLPPQGHCSCYAFGPRAHSQYLPGCLPLRYLLKCHLLKEAFPDPVTFLLPTCLFFSRRILT